eukprot:TRINITY_DN775_c0_g2_i1.p1 TRINITY_DN775_c0_g2~~TRINITY_DN775_c0_g2_i1.p1  ORF type:complete len:3227 (+),score=847.44 TRINITY_DN775_c0_g2_i1:1307-9682(+)
MDDEATRSQIFSTILPTQTPQTENHQSAEMRSVFNSLMKQRTRKGPSVLAQDQAASTRRLITPSTPTPLQNSSNSNNRNNEAFPMKNNNKKKINMANERNSNSTIKNFNNVDDCDNNNEDKPSSPAMSLFEFSVSHNPLSKQRNSNNNNNKNNNSNNSNSIGNDGKTKVRRISSPLKKQPMNGGSTISIKTPPRPTVFEHHPDFDFPDPRILEQLQRLYEIEYHNTIVGRLADVPFEGVADVCLEQQPLPTHSILLREALRCMALCHTVVVQPVSEFDPEKEVELNDNALTMQESSDEDSSDDNMSPYNNFGNFPQGSMVYGNGNGNGNNHSKPSGGGGGYKMAGNLSMAASRNRSSTSSRVSGPTNRSSQTRFRANIPASRVSQNLDIEADRQRALELKAKENDADNITAVDQIPDNVRRMLVAQIRNKTSSMVMQTGVEVQAAERILANALRKKRSNTIDNTHNTHRSSLSPKSVLSPLLSPLSQEGEVEEEQPTDTNTSSSVFSPMIKSDNESNNEEVIDEDSNTKIGGDDDNNDRDNNSKTITGPAVKIRGSGLQREDSLVKIGSLNAESSSSEPDENHSTKLCLVVDEKSTSENILSSDLDSSKMKSILKSSLTLGAPYEEPKPIKPFVSSNTPINIFHSPNPGVHAASSPNLNPTRRRRTSSVDGFHAFVATGSTLVQQQHPATTSPKKESVPDIPDPISIPPLALNGDPSSSDNEMSSSGFRSSTHSNNVPGGASLFYKDMDRNLWEETASPEICPLDGVGQLATVEYRSSSPDESALLLAARCFGFAFQNRVDDTIQIDEFHNPRFYTVHAVNHFNHHRRRMSVLVETPKNEYILYVKGADSVVLDLLKDPSRMSTKDKMRYLPLTLEQMQHQNDMAKADVHSMASKGLRALVLACRKISRSEVQKWLPKYNEAKRSSEHDGRKADAVASLIERDLELIGSTGIEDKIQDGVVETVNRLLQPQTHMWMLTGDMRETAINTGYASGILGSSSSMVTVRESSADVARESLVTKRMDLISRGFWKPGTIQPGLSLCLSGRALRHIIKHASSSGTIKKPRHSIVSTMSTESDIEKSPKRRKTANTIPSRISKIAPAPTKITTVNKFNDKNSSNNNNNNEKTSNKRNRHSIDLKMNDNLANLQKPKNKFMEKIRNKLRRLYGRGKAAVYRNVGEGSNVAERISSDNEIATDATPRARKTSIQDYHRLTAYSSLIHKPMERSNESQAKKQRRSLLTEFMELVSQASTIVCYRMEPEQKAQIVNIVRSLPSEPITLAVGDGGNDVPMIQEAHIGVGIIGNEGTQAVRAADFAVAQFQFLARLMLVHGRFSLRRSGILLGIMLGKNALVTIPFLLFSIFSGISATSPISLTNAIMYNVILTTLPLLYRVCTEKYITDDSALRFPMTYGKHLSSQWLVRYFFVGCLHGLTLFILIFAYTSSDPITPNGNPWSLLVLGETTYFLAVVLSNVYIMLTARKVSRMFLFISILSTASYFGLFVFSEMMYTMFGVFGESLGVLSFLINDLSFWLLLLFPISLTVCYGAIRFARKWIHPNATRLIQEWDSGYRKVSQEFLSSLFSGHEALMDINEDGDGVFVGMEFDGEFDDDESIGQLVDRTNTMYTVNSGIYSQDFGTQESFNLGKHTGSSASRHRKLGASTNLLPAIALATSKFLSPFGQQRTVDRVASVMAGENSLFTHQTEMTQTSMNRHVAGGGSSIMLQKRSFVAQKLLFKEKRKMIYKNHRTLERVLKNLERVSKNLSSSNGVPMADTVIDNSSPVQNVTLFFRDKVLDRLFYLFRLKVTLPFIINCVIVGLMSCVFLGVSIGMMIKNDPEDFKQISLAVLQSFLSFCIFLCILFRQRFVNIYQSCVFVFSLIMLLLEHYFDRSAMFVGGVYFIVFLSLQLEMTHFILLAAIGGVVTVIDGVGNYATSLLFYGILAAGLICINRIAFIHRILFYRTNTNQLNQLRSVQLLHNLAPPHIVPLLRLDFSDEELKKRKLSLSRNAVRFSASISSEHQTAINRARMMRRSSTTVRNTKFSAPSSESRNAAENVIAQEEPSVTVIFIDICNFKQLLVEFEPTNVVLLLDRVCAMLDELCENHGLYKVESVGSCYMACCGLNDTNTMDHTTRCIDFALNAMRCFKKVGNNCMLHLTTGKKGEGSVPFLEGRAGINTGRIIAGVIGVRKPQFCLFGDTVNTASRMMSTANPGDVVCSAEAHRLACDSHHEFVARKIIAKGKGELTTFVVQDDEDPDSPRRGGGTIMPYRRDPQESLRGVFNYLHSDIFNRSKIESMIPMGRLLKFPDEHEKEFTEKRINFGRPILLSMYILMSLLHLFVFFPDCFDRFKLFGSTSDDEKSGVSDLFVILFMAYYCLRTLGSASMTKNLSSRSIQRNSILLLCVEGMVLPSILLSGEQLLMFGIVTVTLLSVVSSLRFFIAFPLTLITATYLFILSIISDSPPIIVLIEYVTLVALTLFSSYLAERASRNGYVKEQAIENQTKEIQRLLHLMLPPNVIALLQHGVASTASRFSNVALLYCDIKGFTQMCSQIEAEIVVGLLNEMFSRFDDLTSRDDKLFKVQTIGDAYVIVSGIDMKQPMRTTTDANFVPQMGPSHHDSISSSTNASTQHVSSGYNSSNTKAMSAVEATKTLIDCGVEMLQIVNSMINPVTGQPMQMRVGIHTGTIIGGVIGRRTLRYDIWGVDAIIANKLEAAGTPGAILISDTTKVLIESDESFCSSFDIKEDEPLEIHGHGSINTYLMTPHIVENRLNATSFGVREDIKLFGDFIVKVKGAQNPN